MSNLDQSNPGILSQKIRELVLGQPVHKSRSDADVKKAASHTGARSSAFQAALLQGQGRLKHAASVGVGEVGRIEKQITGDGKQPVEKSKDHATTLLKQAAAEVAQPGDEEVSPEQTLSMALAKLLAAFRKANGRDPRPNGDPDYWRSYAAVLQRFNEMVADGGTD